MLRNIFERRFGLTELEASTSAAYLLSGSIFLYPICGIIVDRVKRGSIVLQLMTIASTLTLLCFFWMILPPSQTHTPWPAIVCFGAAIGFSPRRSSRFSPLSQTNLLPVLLVVIVPRIVPLEYVSTTLGLHKSVRALAFTYTPVLKLCLQLEHTGTTITQTLAGLWLDSKKKKEEGTGLVAVLSEGNEPHLQWLLNVFLFVNVLHLGAIWGLGYLNEKKQNAQKEAGVQDQGENEDEERQDAPGSEPGTDELLTSPDLSSHIPSDQIPTGDYMISPSLHLRDASSVYQSYGTHPRPRRSQQDTPSMGATTPAEVRRGKLFASLCAATVVFTWGLFLITSVIKIRSRRERAGDL